MAPPRRTTRLGVALLAIHSLQCAAQSMDPILNFCSRWQHASIVKNGTLYIDGGVEVYRPDGHNFTTAANGSNYIGINPWVVTVPMNETWNWWTNITQHKLPKQENPDNAQQPPNGTIRATLFQGPAGQDRIYAFGGSNFLGNTSFHGYATIQSTVNPLWSMDINHNTWSTYASGVDTQPNYGHAAEAEDQGLGFYLNGQIDAGSYMGVPLQGNNTVNLPGMVVIDFNTQSFLNISTPGLPDTYPRAGGNLQYLPDLGGKGILVSLGGAYGNKAGGDFYSQKLATFDTVDVFDIASYLNNKASNGTWYSQKTSGDIPPPRIDTCVVAKSAPDGSSHNIYLYGGRDPMGSKIITYDDIYALSLPSFTWIKVYSHDSERWGHTCHLVGKRQMVTIGGNTAKVQGVCDWEFRSVAIYDLAANLWGGVFIENDLPYNVTKEIVDKIGGTANGKATLTEPTNGWTTPALKAILIPQKKTSAGVIAGATIGSLIGAALIGAIGFLYWRRKRSIDLKKQNERNLVEAPGDTEKAEIEGDLKLPTEAPAKELPFEMDAASNDVLPEMEASHGFSEVESPGFDSPLAELSGDSVPAGARLGVPTIQTSLHPGEAAVPEKETYDIPIDEDLKLKMEGDAPRNPGHTFEELRDIKEPIVDPRDAKPDGDEPRDEKK